MTLENNIINDDCRSYLKNSIEDNSIDLVYLDPPFFSQKEYSATNRRTNQTFSFSDKFTSLEEYIELMSTTLYECKRVLKKTGSIFLHCDKYASHYLRIILEKIFEEKNFQSEIIWNYRRWSNSKKGLLNSHQNIYFFSKSEDFKFNSIYTDYSPTTNVDQILQEREKTPDGKSVYKRDKNGNIVECKEKKGVPLSDVWDIPYLNPKAKERCGYPTQKPIELLKRIIQISTSESDLVLDPFCGSGTTCVAAKALNRNFIGIDINPEAVKLAKKRINEMIITSSTLLKKGKDAYIEKSENELALLKLLNAIPVQRNSGIDGFIQNDLFDKNIPVKIQKKSESIEEAISKLEKASEKRDFPIKILIQTNLKHENTLIDTNNYSDIKFIKAPSLQTQDYINQYYEN